MKEPEDLAELAARALANAEPSSHPNSIDPRTVQLVAAAIRARRRSRRLPWATAGLAAAAAVVLSIGVSRKQTVAPLAVAPHAELPSVGDGPGRPSPPVATTLDAVDGNAAILRPSGRTSAIQGSVVGRGDEVVADRGARVTFSLPTGTRIAVEDGGDLAVVELGPVQIFRLGEGSMRALVHKLTEGERFVVRTPDAEVEVRGTSFRVAMAPPDDGCRAASKTRVQVYEGVVTVRAGSTEARVGPGESWPPRCTSVALGSPAASAARSPTETAPASSQGRSIDRSQLAEQNDLYSNAIALRERGDADGALALFDRLAAKYPAGPLAENAAAERMRLLASVHRADAARAATDYLARYPSGFARRDAETILARERSAR